MQCIAAWEGVWLIFGGLLFTYGGFLVVVPLFFAALFRVFGRHIQAVVIDILVFIAVWVFAITVTGITPPFGIKGSGPNYEVFRYTTMMIGLSAILYCMSIVLYWKFGGSIGKLVSGYKTVHVEGGPLDFKTAFLRSSILFFLGIPIFVPELVLVCSFGGDYITFSLALFELGVVAWIYIAVLALDKFKWSHNLVEYSPTRLEKWLDIRTVPRKEI